MRVDAAAMARLLATRVKARRYALGISQEALAIKVGVDRTYASQIERAIANPSLQVLCSLATALECSLLDLFSDNVEGGSST